MTSTEIGGQKLIPPGAKLPPLGIPSEGNVINVPRRYEKHGLNIWRMVSKTTRRCSGVHSKHL